MGVFDWTVVFIFSLNAALLVGLGWAFHQPRMLAHRIPGYTPMKVPARQRWRTMATIGALSVALSVGGIYAAKTWLLGDREHDSLVLTLVQGAAVILLYDFIYYFAHRVMHIKKVMRFVHGVHHRARFPTVLESLYQDPIELITGLALLFAATWLVGLVEPVTPMAFLFAFCVFSVSNVLVHSGLVFPWRVLAPINAITRKHHTHHSRNFQANFASITPVPDWIFGTAR